MNKLQIPASSPTPAPQNQMAQHANNTGVFLKWAPNDISSLEYASENIQSCTGYSAKDLVQGDTSYPQIIHADDRKTILALIRDSADSHTSHFELPPYRLLHRDGSETWVHHTMTLLNNTKEEAPQYSGHLLNLTKGLEAQKESLHQHLYTMLKLMTDTAPDMIWAKDLDDKYIFANKAICEKLLMCDKGESPLGNNDLFYANREKERRHQHTFGQICLNSDQIIKKTKKPSRFLEDGLVRGEYLALDVHKTPFFCEQGKLIGTIGVGRDVTNDLRIKKALEESEKRYRLLAESVRDVIWTLSPNFTPTYITPSIQELSGYSPDEFLTLPLEVHLPPLYRKKFIAIRKFLSYKLEKKLEKPTHHWEFEFIRKDGSIIWLETIASKVKQEDEDSESFICITRETTKRVKAQQEVVKAKEIALASSQTKSEFLANMSHEIRTPMNGVLGMLQLVRETHLNKEQQGYINTALCAGESLLNLINDILDFSKIEAGKIELTEEPFSLQPLLTSITDSFYNLLNEKNLSMSFTVHNQVPEEMIADSSRLRQILINLLSNAVKFTDKGNISIETTLHPGDRCKSSQLHFKISDEGIGISKEFSPHLFKPFVQADGSSSRKHRGTGLGLSIVSKLVKEMEGSVQIESTTDKGTTVYFDIKVQLMVDPKTKYKETTHPDTPSLAPMHILIVEDEKINAMVVTAMLEKLGQTVTLATNGEAAIALANTKRFDCILMDIQMPDMDGVETTKIIRNNSSGACFDIPIIALTAHAMKGDRERFLNAGMNDYLTKPVAIEEIQELLFKTTDSNPRC